MEKFVTRSGSATKKKKINKKTSISSSQASQKSSSECDSDDPAVNNDEINQGEGEVATSVTGSIDLSNKPKNKRKKYSIVWNYFKRSSDRKLAKCITCGKEYKTSGNTSNLSDHLKRFHSTLSGNTNENLEEVTDLTSVVGSTSTSTSARSSARSISPFFKRGLYYDDSSQRKKHLDRAVLDMITLDFQPFTIVTDAGFKTLVALLDPRYKLPSPYTLGNILEETYLEECTKLQNELHEVDFVAITTDSWTSTATESYVTVTCHYVDDNFNLKSRVLSTKPLPNGINHTSENLADALKEIFEKWQIRDKIICIVTDNAANMIKMCTLLKIKHLPCYAHTLNLVVQENLMLVQDILKKAKHIVTFFKSSPLAMDTFKKEQNVKEPLKLIQEVHTRWNSTFFMIKRILQINDALGRALLKLRKAPQPLTVDDITILADIEKVLNCFQEATRKISGNAYVTISLIIPITFGIQNFLNQCLDTLATEEGKTLCRNLAESVEKRLAPYELRSAARFGTILDPRFKKEGFRSKENATATAALLENDMFCISQKSRRDESNLDVTASTASSSTSSSSLALFGFLQHRLDEKVKSVTADVIVTKRQYLERHNAPENTDPLAFWKITGSELYPLNLLAKKYFCVPATSVDSERIFSSTGLVISDRRSRLKADKVNMIIFLHDCSNISNDNSNEIQSHKESLKRLQETDPEFYKFLEENDKKLLQFNISDDEDEEDTTLHKPDKELEIASDESDFEAEDEDRNLTQSQQKVTLHMLRKWQSDLQTDNTKNTIAHVIQAFHAALLRVSNEEEEISDYKVDGSAIFNAVIQLCVLELSPAIRKFLGLKSTKMAPHKCKKFVKIKTLLQMYFTDLLKILGSVTSSNILTVLLKHLHHMLPLLQSFRQSRKLIVKKLIHLWGTSDDVVRILCFLCILRLTTTNQVSLLDTVLKTMYMTYIVNSKFVSVNTLSSINFMRRSLVEMFSLDVTTSYQHIFLYVRQLAIHLRTALTVHKTENTQTVYNWQFINSLKLFGTVLSAKYDKPEMQPLVYPFVQVCLGTVKLVPTAQYFPLRFQIIQILTDFSKSTRVFIPILPLILEVLTIYDFNKKAKLASKKPLNLTCLLRFSNSQMTENGFKDAVIDQVYASLLEYLESQSHLIAFPDLSLFSVLQIKQFVDKCTVSGYLKKMKQIIEKIQQNNAFIEKERKNITFELTDFDRITAWETNIRNKNTPLSIYYESWNKIRMIKKNKEMTNTSAISDYQLPTVRKIKKESTEHCEPFPSDSESDEIKFDSESNEQEQVIQKTKNRKKRKSKSIGNEVANVFEDDNLMQKDTVEDFNMDNW